MPLSVLVVALVQLMGGLGGFGMGLSLMPTDMSRAWLVVGATLFSGGMVSLAIGFAAQVFDYTSARAGVQPAASAVLAPVPPHAELELPAQAGLGQAGLVVAGGAMLGAGVVAAHVSSDQLLSDQLPSDHGSEAPPPAPAPADEFEHELFASSERTHEATAVAHEVERSEREFPATDLRLSPVFPEPDGAHVSHEVMEEMGPLLMDRLMPQLHGEPAEAEDRDEAEREAEDTGVDDEPQEHAALHVAPPMMPQAVSGLIADDDLAALQAEQAPLAPLDTLDVVGAYDSGGVRFTMYSDGSVFAAGPGGEHRYRSLEALRQRLDAGLAAV